MEAKRKKSLPYKPAPANERTHFFFLFLSGIGKTKSRAGWQYWIKWMVIILAASDKLA